jgi:endonuclease VIII
VPEGDSIFRTAASLRSWLSRRTITAASARDPRLGIGRLVGRTLDDVSTHGKHLFMEFGAPPGGEPLLLRTHMMMTGSWHVYGAGDRWWKPPGQAVVTLTAGERTAVCFNAPVVELVSKKRSVLLRTAIGLGPDILDNPPDADEMIRRAALIEPSTPIGVVLLDQHVAAGIGNIYRCESLFLEGIHPRTPRSALTHDGMEALLIRAGRLMRANLSPSGAASPNHLVGGQNVRWVYGRTGRPCRRCGSPIVSERLGAQPRTAYLCPTCQPPPTA